MLKQSPSRNQRTRGFKLKHGIKIFALIAVGIWLLYQLKHTLDKKSSYEEYETKKLGRKGLQPWINKPYESMDDPEESKHQGVKELSSGSDDRVEEEEPEEVEDLIDVEDKEKEEENEEEDMNLLEEQGHNEVEKDILATSYKH